MAFVYILFSKQLNKHYIGSCVNLEQRVEQHLSHSFSNAFTSKANDWTLIFNIKDLEYKQARHIETHIKKNEKC